MVQGKETGGQYGRYVPLLQDEEILNQFRLDDLNAWLVFSTGMLGDKAILFDLEKIKTESQEESSFELYIDHENGEWKLTGKLFLPL